MIAIGVGCRRGCPADDIVALVREALAALGPYEGQAGVVSIAEKRGEPGLAEAAARLGLSLTFLDLAALGRFSGAAQTHSRRIAALYGLPSIAETAALAGAGAGAVLLVPRKASAQATCAIAGPPGATSDDPQAQVGQTGDAGDERIAAPDRPDAGRRA